MNKVTGSLHEDTRSARFVTGRGCFADDDRTARRLHAVFARCPHSHARITNIDVRRALETTGVTGVWTGRDMHSAAHPYATAKNARGFRIARRPALAQDRVRHIGEAVAVVVAETAHIARDAADRIEVEYEAIPAIGDARAARAENAPLVHADVPRNLALAWRSGDAESVRAAFESAAHIVEQHVRLPRTTALALEPRACTASWDRAAGALALLAPLQSPHLARAALAAQLGVQEHRIHITCSDTGGAFGTRITLGPEEIAVCFAAMRIGRPVHWASVRREAFHSDMQGHDHDIDVLLAFDREHRLLAARLHSIANIGAYADDTTTDLPALLLSAAFPGPYEVPVTETTIDLTYTNTAPVGAVRGAGRQEACFAVERALDIAARRFNLDPVELRRRNLTTRSEHANTLNRALDNVVRISESLRTGDNAAHEHVGVGYAIHVDATAPGPGHEVRTGEHRIGLRGQAEVRVHPDGSITVLTNATDQGQHHDAMFRRVVCTVLPVAPEDVAVESGDTMHLPAGAGTILGRGAAVCSRAVRGAAEAVLETARRLAALRLGVAPDEIVVNGGTFAIDTDPRRAMTWQAIAALAYGGSGTDMRTDHALVARVSHQAGDWSYSPGVHCAIVRVDGESGNIVLLHYIAVDDIGHPIDAVGVRNMMEGGIGHGLGQVLLECVTYDENGQLFTASFMDYALPRLDSMPGFIIQPIDGAGDEVSRSAGSAGAIAAPAAIANAVLAAIAPLGVEHIDPPLTPARIWEAIHQARKGAG